MLNDPIVASVREVREELAGKFNYDVHAIFADMRQRESQAGERLVKRASTKLPKQAAPANSGIITEGGRATTEGR